MTSPDSQATNTQRSHRSFKEWSSSLISGAPHRSAARTTLTMAYNTVAAPTTNSVTSETVPDPSCYANSNPPQNVASMSISCWIAEKLGHHTPPATAHGIPRRQEREVPAFRSGRRRPISQQNSACSSNIGIEDTINEVDSDCEGSDQPSSKDESSISNYEPGEPSAGSISRNSWMDETRTPVSSTQDGG